MVHASRDTLKGGESDEIGRWGRKRLRDGDCYCGMWKTRRDENCGTHDTMYVCFGHCHGYVTVAKESGLACEDSDRVGGDLYLPRTLLRGMQIRYE